MEFRYEVQDLNLDATGAPSLVYRTSTNDLIPIPGRSLPWTDNVVFPSGLRVLVRYPETTCLYRARVEQALDAYKLYGLAFDEDSHRIVEVPRRFVLGVRG